MSLRSFAWLRQHDSALGSRRGFVDIRADLMSTQRVAVLIERIAFCALLATLFYSIAASASDTNMRAVQSLSTVRIAAEEFVRDAVRATLPASLRDTASLVIVGSEPDPRLQLADCGAELRAFSLNGAAIRSRNTIGVRCADESRGAWTVYVTVTAQVERPVLVLKNSLARDAHVGADDVVLETRRVPAGETYPTDINAIRDQHLKRGVNAGAIVSSDVLARDLLVRRGQEVTLALDHSGLAIRVPGVALNDGGFADRVRVQNRTSLKVVEGTVESGNVVRVGM